MTLESQKVKKHSVVNVLWFIIFYGFVVRVNFVLQRRPWLLRRKNYRTK